MEPCDAVSVTGLAAARAAGTSSAAAGARTGPPWAPGRPRARWPRRGAARRPSGGGASGGHGTDDVRVARARPQLLPAPPADEQGGLVVPAAFVLELHRGIVNPAVLVAPLHQRHEHRVQVHAL